MAFKLAHRAKQAKCCVCIKNEFGYLKKTIFTFFIVSFIFKGIKSKDTSGLNILNGGKKAKRGSNQNSHPTSEIFVRF